MKKHNLKLTPNIKPKDSFGRIGKKMYWEPDEKPTVESISCDYMDDVSMYIESAVGEHFHNEENKINRIHWRIG